MVTARTNEPLDPVERALADAGLATCRLGRELTTGDGVRVATMHRLKGIELRAVAVVDASVDTIPHPKALTDRAADKIQNRHDLLRERCLLYVACTRAREHLWVGWSGKPSRFLGPMLGE